MELKRLQQLEASMRSANQYLWQETAQPVQRIEYYYQYNRKQPGDSVLFYRAKGLYTHTANVLSTLDSVRRVLLNATGNTPKLVHLDANRQVQQVMVGEAGAALALQRRLHKYAAFLQTMNPAEKGTDALRVTPTRLEQEYTHTPVVAALAQLTRQETEVLLLTHAALAQYLAKSGTTFDAYYSTVAHAVAETRTVLPGGQYQAKLFLTHLYHPDFIRAMTVNKHPVPVDAQSRGVVSFVVPPTVLGNADSVSTYWTGSITTLTSSGDRTYTVRVPYTIVKSPCQ
ncbi:hypothetical protein BXP70_27020 [Hymenobacter crusticola]|uniref:Uncharacterized protein n=1 Tax=Hymenobacter crusticola TaxID=1770526 RepID=A0A243W5S4_9BACT|nr:hypothetical protein BXP70_27020 [Hymenobacter crusticola]